ncbi:MAG: hypothetical protein RLY67_1069 [Pseudomonadota bacterium]
MSAETQVVASIIFALAILHTFSTKYVERLAQKFPRHHGLLHFFAEVECVFGIWAFILFATLIGIEGLKPAMDYIDGRNYTEPLFVFAIMVVAGSRPVLYAAQAVVAFIAQRLPLDNSLATYLVIMTVIPLLGSFITEPAAMTLAAFMLLKILKSSMSSKLLYATIGVLFVNVSIGGTLTHFAAPPVLMVAATWNWDTPFMLTNFGWKSALAVAINGAAVSYWFRKELVAASRASLASADDAPSIPPVPGSFIALHLLLIASIVFFAHHPAIFLGILLIFLAIAAAYPEHQDRLILREGLLVGFFLAGLVIIGGMQAWWLQPLLTQMSPSAVFFGAAGLTAFTDNAALTYLGSLVQGLSDEFKYALVAGAVAGGGLTVIANAPNPAGATLLKVRFEGQIIQPMGLLLGALLPTAVAIACLKYL